MKLVTKPIAKYISCLLTNVYPVCKFDIRTKLYMDDTLLIKSLRQGVYHFFYHSSVINK